MRRISVLILLLLAVAVFPSGAYGDTGDYWANFIERATEGTEVVVSGDWILSRDVVVPAGVTVVLACDDRGNGHDTVRNPDGEEGLVGSVETRVVIPEDTTLIVFGTVLVNAHTCWADWNCNLAITGGYAEVVNNGSIIIMDGGTWDNIGETSGRGSLISMDGSVLRDRFMVVHWRGGTTAEAQYRNGIFPFNEYSMHSVSCTIFFESGSRYVGSIKMYINDGFRFAELPIVGQEDGFIRLNDGSTAVKTYVDGRSSIVIDGGATFSYSEILLQDPAYSRYHLDTSSLIIPLDGDIDIVLSGGRYIVESSFKAMPGATISVHSSSIYVGGGSSLTMYEVFDDRTSWAGTEYPSRVPAYMYMVDSSMDVEGSISGRIFCDDLDSVSVSGTTRIAIPEAMGEVGFGDTGSWASLHCTVLVNGEPVESLQHYCTDSAMNRQWNGDWQSLGEGQLLYSRPSFGEGYHAPDFGGILDVPSNVYIVLATGLLSLISLMIVAYYTFRYFHPKSHHADIRL